jgi:hypothetical protein
LLKVYTADVGLELVNASREYSSLFLYDIILRNCVWRAGKKNAVIRGQAMVLAQAMLSSNVSPSPGMFSLESVASHFEDKIIPVVISNLDEDDVSTRKVVLSNVKQLLSLISLWNGTN